MSAARILEAPFALAVCAVLLASGSAHAAPLNPDGAGFVSLLRRAGLYREAAAEVQRQDALDGAPDLDAQLLWGLGLDLARTGNTAAAIRMVQLAVSLTQDEATSDERQLTLGTLQLKAGSYPAGERLFSKIQVFSGNALVRARAETLACVGNLWSIDADPARRCVPKLLSASGSVSERARREAQRDLDELGASDGWRPWFGGTLSAILPGLGQAAAGEPLDGLLALLVNGGFGASVVVTSLSGDLLDGALLLVALLSRYYWGNIQHGAAAWTAIGERHKRRAADALMRLLAGLPPPTSR
jgi:hypothetical protein